MVDEMNPIDWTLPAADILAELLTDVWKPTDAAITVAEIVTAVGTDAARLVVGTLQTGAGFDPLLSSSYQAISTVGMSLSGADRQAMIDELAIGGEWPDAVRDGVKALGGVWVGRWSLEGFDAEPTLSQVEARKDEEAEVVHRQKAKLAGVRFGEQFAIDGDAGETMAAIWESI
jgi:hypothetical protein